MSKIQTYIDFDGVLYNTNEILDQMIKEEGISYENQDQVRKFIKKINFYQMIKNAKEINGSITSLLKITEDKKYNTTVLTHVNSYQEAKDKIKILKEISDKIKVIPVPKYIEKCDYVKPENAILVDDYKVNLINWSNKFGLPIHFDPDLKQSQFPVISSLSELEQTIHKKYAKVLKLSNKY